MTPDPATALTRPPRVNKRTRCSAAVLRTLDCRCLAPRFAGRLYPRKHKPFAMLIVDREAYLVLGAATGFALAGRFRRQEPSIASAVAATAAVRICAAILCLPKSAFSNTLAVAWFEILASAVVTVASIFGSIVAYRLLFHPLTRYPGPKIAAVTQLWTFWQRAQCRGAFVNEKLHELYGDIVRIGTDPSPHGFCPLSC